MNGAATEKKYPANPAIAILGVPFDNVTPAEATTLVQQMLASRQPHYLVKADIDFAVQAQGDYANNHRHAKQQPNEDGSPARLGTVCFRKARHRPNSTPAVNRPWAFRWCFVK